MIGKLYSVALPIGNVLDLTERARAVLQSVDAIACEDTRKLKELVKRAGIETRARFLAYHSYNEVNSAAGIVKLIQEGADIALVSDAGTPRVSDPGFAIVSACYNAKIPVLPVPGALALTALLSVCPLPIEPLLYLGFISPKQGKRRKTLMRYNAFEGAVFFYESVHRIGELLQALLEQWGDCRVFIGRELTKEHEEFYLGSIQKTLQWIVDKRGEFAFIVDKKPVLGDDEEE